MHRSKFWLATTLAMLSSLVHAGEGFSGSAALEGRYFFNAPLSDQQSDERAQFSLSVQPEYYREWADGKQSLTAVGFGRVDQVDEERTHADLRELYWQQRGETLEWRVGVRKVFWGMIESNHLVDVINQNDQLENLDGEDKLGQPMVNLAWVTGNGTFDFFVLPYFREREFPGVEARFRPYLPVDDENPVYESSRREQHADGAVRYTHSLGGWDLGLSYFDGTQRDPRFLFAVDDVRIIPNNPPLQCQLALEPGVGDLLTQLAALLPALNPGCEQFFTIEPVNPHLRPAYDQMQQAGLELQRLMDGWFLKLEAIHRQSEAQEYTAVATGFEYTWGAVRESAVDVTLVTEYLYDSRGSIDENSDQALALRKFFTGESFTVAEAQRLQNLEAETFSPFQNDAFIGARVALNDEQSTEFLTGAIVDLESNAALISFEGSRRIAEGWKLAAEIRHFADVPVLDPLYSFSRDTYLQVELTRYF